MKSTANVSGPAPSGRQIPRLLAALALAAFLTLPACARPYGYKPPTNVDVFERAPVGEAVDVTDFTWAYEKGGRIQVTGKAKNNSGRTLMNITLFLMLFDEKGKAVALGEARLTPWEVPAGGEGTFSLLAPTDRPKGIKHIRLLTNAQRE
jgi:hypothetical protein